MNEELKPNSYKYKAEQKEKEEKRVEKVVSGKVVTKKKSAGKKFAQSFISEDATDVKSYIVDDVMVPALKSLLSDMVRGAVDMFLFGETRGGGSGYSSRYSSNYNQPQTSYQKYYSQKNQPRNNRPRSNMGAAIYEDDIILATRMEAEDVLGCLEQCIHDYGSATVADLYDALGMPTAYTQTKYGWYEIRSARVEKVHDGYMLNLPRTSFLE